MIFFTILFIFLAGAVFGITMGVMLAALVFIMSMGYLEPPWLFVSFVGSWIGALFGVFAIISEFSNRNSKLKRQLRKHTAGKTRIF